MTDIATQAKNLLNQSGSPKRRAVPRVCPVLATGEHLMIGEEGEQISVWRLDGTQHGAPAALLVHGWEDDNSLWSPLVELLQSQGKAVVVFDLPGHGYSQGEACGLDLTVKAIQAVSAQCGPIDSVATHSFSGMALARALAQGLDVRNVVLIAPPARQSGQFEKVWRRFQVPEDVIIEALSQGLAQGRFFDLETLAPSLKPDALFVHSLDDRQCPADDARRAAQAWPRAQFYEVDGMGHRDLVRDPEVVAVVANWLVG